ncbi:hypothetical protein ANCCEY_15717, partial [Ancylostoma ceylanicum]
LVENGKEASAPTSERERLTGGYNPFDDDCEEATITEENVAATEKVLSCSIGVDTSDLMRVSADTPQNVPNSPTSSTCSKQENSSVQLKVDCLKSRVSTLEAERESHLVDLSLLRRKLENLGVKEIGFV